MFGGAYYREFEGKCKVLKVGARISEEWEKGRCLWKMRKFG